MTQTDEDADNEVAGVDETFQTSFSHLPGRRIAGCLNCALYVFVVLVSSLSEGEREEEAENDHCQRKNPSNKVNRIDCSLR